jgi:Epoxide hydrolase N terminus
MSVSEAELDDLRRRVEATRWASKELVADRSQGVQLAAIRASETLIRWANAEAGAVVPRPPPR